MRVAPWRAMHVRGDSSPHVIEDEIGVRLAAPDEGRRRRPDMEPRGTRGFRAAIVARGRFIEDQVAEQVGHGVAQYVVLGAGLDTFAPRKARDRRPPEGVRDRPAGHPGLEAPMPDRTRLRDPDWLRLVPVDFEAGADWWERLSDAGFDPGRPAVVACTGVTMYLTAAGTPFISFYTPQEMLAPARVVGFKDVHHVSGTALAARYFADRTDGLRPSSGEDLLLATTWRVVA
ncbi:class I SAM-dependent methyltransferase [Streptomyces sp. OV198]|uniref:class I SAM-dependent methyltransferase n=1 Tax=Streptomyces sp. OV198 TaxID=1882787 RepID=UPI00211BD348|nr:class I SAM-dependent methyltransferase [Streptomyces sp. OV198]